MTEPGLITNELDRLQAETMVWRNKNFPGQDAIDQLTGVCEEVGELGHAQLKQKQNIRGTSEEHEANGKDAVGDTMIYLMGYSTLLGVPVSASLGRGIASRNGETDDHERQYLHLYNRVGRLSRWEADSNSPTDWTTLKCRVIGEIVWALNHYCHLRGWDLLECTQEAWNEVQKRDWIKNNIDGSAA